MEAAGLILAGGRSTRMGGRDKAFAPLAGEPLIHHAARRMREAGVLALAISSNAEPRSLAGFGLHVLPDLFAGRPGPLAGIHAGLGWAARLGATRLFSAPVDTVFYPADVLLHLKAAAPDAIAVCASRGRRHPVVALWPVSLAAALEDHFADGGSRRVNDFIDTQRHSEVEFAGADGDGPDPFFNINTPGDLAEAERRLKGRGA